METRIQHSRGSISSYPKQVPLLETMVSALHNIFVNDLQGHVCLSYVTSQPDSIQTKVPTIHPKSIVNPKQHSLQRGHTLL